MQSKRVTRVKERAKNICILFLCEQVKHYSYLETINQEEDEDEEEEDRCRTGDTGKMWKFIDDVDDEYCHSCFTI